MEKIINGIIENKIIVIFRKLYDEDLLLTAEALYQGGIRCFEVTFDQADVHCLDKTTKAIKLLNTNFPDVFVGAGTVLTEKQVDAACKAGAKYIISPNTNLTVMKITKNHNLISIPGALTPTEILLANEAGADLVKLFPSNSIGLSYIKDLTGPLNNIKFMLAAGINESNLIDYLKIGCVAFGISGRLTDQKLIKEKKYAELTSRAQEMVAIVKAFNQSKK
ncbi:MAG: bifunctional 4-hydroxy-2-oxoglutarate aldolase/2-dehydro-3-deoxy-phosphogluconate aldolase [Erysipelotrichales bacterium]|nr:bifunctional 4-hydroxy-2-oxoglutarate aldolase/2-dehydro-3-deoxy-phosphogluconate aldolase [Erysipelotrichales bacterium]